MYLKDIETLWGIPIFRLLSYSKKYKLYISLLYLLDIALVSVLTVVMYLNNVSNGTYFFISIFSCVLVHFILYYKLHPERWESYRFYKKFSSCELIEKKYKVSENDLYSLLYCIGYKRLKQNKSFEDYKEMVLSSCCEDCSVSLSLMKYIKKYESESGNLTCYIIQKGKKQYFIDFAIENDGGSLNESNNTGNAEDTSAESVN